jgi:hypothetical protein
MSQSEFETVDADRFKDLPSLSIAEAAWMAGVTIEAYEQFMSVVGVEDVQTTKPDRLVRTAFTLLGQKESQLLMLRLQLAAALQREKELAELLGSKLSQHTPLQLDFLTAPGGGKEKKKKRKKKGK